MDTAERAWYSTYSYYDKTWTFPKNMTLFEASGELMGRQFNEASKPGAMNSPKPVMARWTAERGWEWAPFAGSWNKLAVAGLGDEAASAVQGTLIGLGIVVIGFALLASAPRAS